jgi:hypothetical protein
MLMQAVLAGVIGAAGWDAAHGTCASNALGQPAAIAKPPAAPDSPAWLFPVAKLDDALPDWLYIGGEYRARVEAPDGIGYAGLHDSYLLGRLRVNVTFHPQAWLLFQGEVQDARFSFGHPTANRSSFENTWALWEGYAQLGSSTAGWLDALAGRQALSFGDERVIGPSNWSNVGRTFNIVRFDLHHAGTKISVFAASVVPGDNADPHSAHPGNNLYGVYGSLQNIIPEALFEPYVLWRLAPASSALPETLARGHLDEVTVGFHWKGNLPIHMDYTTELDWQTGSLGTASIGAWAGYAGIGKTFVRVAAWPRVFVEGNYASGTRNLAGRRWSTFDQLYPSNHDKYGFTDQVGRRNLVQVRVGVEERPARGWTLKQAFAGFWLATSNDNFYGNSGAIVVAAHPGASRHIGNELDLLAEYQWNRGLSFGFGYARLFAGAFLKTTRPGHDYAYPYAYLQYNFANSR